MASAFDDVLREAAAMPDPAVTLPPHLRPDAAAHARRLIAAFPERRRTAARDVTARRLTWCPPPIRRRV